MAVPESASDAERGNGKGNGDHVDSARCGRPVREPTTHTGTREAHMIATDPKPTPDRIRPQVHHGTFAEGESDPKSFPEDDHVGTFAEGELKPDLYREETHVGTFAEGEART
jgi:hypothetical protein